MFLARPAHSQQIHACHQRALPQRENACAAFAASCLLQGLGFDEWRGRPVDQELVAYLAGMVALADDYPTDADPGTALQAAWGFRRSYAYPLERADDLSAVGASPAGVIKAVEAVTEGVWTALPLKGRDREGRPWSDADVWALADLVLSPAAARWEAQVVFNYQTGHLAALEGGGQGWDHVLFGEETMPCAWDVGHVTSLAGVVGTAVGGRALVIRDSSPQFGWRGYHAELADAMARALARSDGSQGGVLVLCRRSDLTAIAETVASALPHVEATLWDNGSRYREPVPLPPTGHRHRPAGS